MSSPESLENKLNIRPTYPEWLILDVSLIYRLDVLNYKISKLLIEFNSPKNESKEMFIESFLGVYNSEELNSKTWMKRPGYLIVTFRK